MSILSERARYSISVGCWLTAYLLFVINLLTPQAKAVENYWDAWPFSLKFKNVDVRTSLISSWPSSGTQALWQKAMESAVDDMDSNTNLAVQLGSTNNSVKTTYALATNMEPWYGAITTWESYNAITGVTIDCAKNYYAPNASVLPQCGLETNLVTHAQVNINYQFPGYYPGTREFEQLNMSHYSVRRRVVTHELMHVPGHGHTSCDMSSVTKIQLNCSGQRELTSHDISWVNLRYP